jgi:hypothetical protein
MTITNMTTKASSTRVKATATGSKEMKQESKDPQRKEIL